MDPSHARKYADREIELAALQILKQEYPNDFSIPIDIDQIVQKHDLIDNIVPIELLEDKFEVAALLFRKPNGKLDILIDEDTFNRQWARASFSIAHEFGHVVLHKELWDGCSKIEDSLVLHQRIKDNYNTVEKAANYFAGALLMPWSALYNHVSKLYAGLVKEHGFDSDLILQKIYSGVAKGYRVSALSAEIRIKDVNLLKPIREALAGNSSTLILYLN